jgi:hypothetical protein
MSFSKIGKVVLYLLGYNSMDGVGDFDVIYQL